jgi:hypothetical protein
MGKLVRQIHDPAPMSDAVPIQSRDFWVKVVEMLQQNWALIEPEGDQATVYFLHDLGGVFDEISYESPHEAQTALCINGFRRFDADPSFAKICAPPKPPFRRVKHPNGRIYSSGRFWVTP